jgi:hypothetical protein
MNNILKFLLIICLMLTYRSAAHAEEVAESLLLQFSKGDLSTIERAMQEAFDAQPVQGESSAPVSSPYAFGTITARGIEYSFLPRIHQTSLMPNGIQFKLSLRSFRGLIKRLEMNASGTQVCTNTAIVSPQGDIPVSVVVHPTVTPAGDVQLVVSESTIDLNEDNFEVRYPEECDVIFGLNWLVSWTLPSLIQSYKDTISSALGSALAKGLIARTAEISPFLSLNVTLPFEGHEIPSFNVAVAVRPYRIDISPERFQSSFATSITIDPDEVVGFSNSSQWPEDVSFLGISWDFMTALLNEAQAKGVIRSTIRGDHPAIGQALSHDLWLKAFPGLHGVISPSDLLSLEVLGGSRYEWKAEDNLGSLADLAVENLRFRLRSGSMVLCEIQVNAQAIFSLESAKDRLLTGRLQTASLKEPRVVENSGPLSRDFLQNGLAALASDIEEQIQKSPEHARDLIQLTLPSMKIGNHEILISNVRTVGAGLILPLLYAQPH